MDPVHDLSERLQRLRQQFVGAEPPDLPTGHLQQPEEGRLYWSGTLAPVIGAAQFTLSSAGLYVPAGVAGTDRRHGRLPDRARTSWVAR